MVRVYCVVEGPHDVELVGRLLKWWGGERIQMMEQVDPFWHPLIPTAFPHKGDLLARVPSPTFFRADDFEVAVVRAIGDSKLARTLHADLGSTPAFRAEQLDAVGVVLDADDKAPAARWRALSRAIQFPPTLGAALPIEPNEVAPSEPRFGVLVLPGDGTRGTLEDMLIACGKIVYPQLLRKAKTYLHAVDRQARRGASKSELNGLANVSDRKKALFASMATPLRPGKAMQVSIQDNRWLCETTRTLPSVRGCLAFMEALLGRPPSKQVPSGSSAPGRSTLRR